MVRKAKVKVVRPRRRYRSHVVSTGLSFGSALAIVLSYVEHKSIIWAILHGILSWIYVIYYAIVYRIL